MIPSFQNSSELLKNAAEQNLYQQLIFQLSKDFNLAGIDLELSTELLPVALKEQLQELIKELLLYNFNAYSNLLYITDIPEKEAVEAATSDIDFYAEQSTFLILKRVWKKVWFKRRFSS